MRHFVLAALFSLIGTPTFACSCYGWEGGLVSEFVGKYTSFWGVPVRSELQPSPTGRPRLIVSYQIEVLEGFGRLETNQTEVLSSIEDGGSCGIQLTMGVPQFFSAYGGRDGKFGVNSCTPLIPYNAIKNYLENGVDAIVPAQDECFDENDKLILDINECAVWEGTSLDPWGRHGQDDWLGYFVSWRDKKTKDLISP